jgi:hypothetical protein
MPEFVAISRKLAAEYRVPILLVKDYSRYNPASYAGPLDPAGYDAEIVKARAAGEPVFDIVQETPWARKTDAETAYRAIFADIEPGLTFMSMHFNQPGDFEVVNAEGARIRTEEYALFRTPRIREWVAEFGMEVIGMRELRDELRDTRSAGR